jgi:hypothetical protein
MLDKIKIALPLFQGISSIKYHQNPSISSWDDTCRWMDDRHIHMCMCMISGGVQCSLLSVQKWIITLPSVKWSKPQNKQYSYSCQWWSAWHLITCIFQHKPAAFNGHHWSNICDKKSYGSGHCWTVLWLFHLYAELVWYMATQGYLYIPEQSIC